MSDTEAGAGIDIEAFHRGDPEAFRMLLESQGHLIRSITASYAGDGDERDDLYQEVCVRIWKQRHRYEHRGSLSGWIARLTHYHARNWRASKLARASAMDRYSVHVAPVQDARELLTDPGRLLSYRRFLDRLEHALAKLPARQAEAFIVVHLKGNSPNAAARKLGVSPATIRSHLRHARIKLRTLLKGSKDELS